jgi:hypothetical protein
MDGLSVAANVAGLISLANELIQFGYMYGSSALGYQQEVQAVTSEITQLSGILNAIQPIIQRCHDNPVLRKEDVDSCKETLLEIEQVLASASPEAGRLWRTGRRLIWPLKQRTLKTLLEIVVKHKATFILGLAAQGTCALFVPLVNRDSDLLLREREAASRDRLAAAEERRMMVQSRKRMNPGMPLLNIFRTENATDSRLALDS